jgi:hypothetical protein
VLAILKSWLGEGLAPPCQIPGFEIQLSAVIFPIQQFQPTSAASLNDVNCHTSQLVNNAERIVTGMTLQMSYYGVHLLQMSYYGVHLLFAHGTTSISTCFGCRHFVVGMLWSQEVQEIKRRV